MKPVVLRYNTAGVSLGLSSVEPEFDISGFIATGQENGVPVGHGTIKVKQTVVADDATAPGATIHVTREYTIPAADSPMVIIVTKVRRRMNYYYSN